MAGTICDDGNRLVFPVVRRFALARYVSDIRSVGGRPDHPAVAEKSTAV